MIVQFSRLFGIKQVKSFTNLRFLVVSQLGPRLHTAATIVQLTPQVSRRRCKPVGAAALLGAFKKKVLPDDEAGRRKAEKKGPNGGKRTSGQWFKMGSRPKTSLQLYRDCMRLVKHVAGTSVRIQHRVTCCLHGSGPCAANCLLCLLAESESGHAARDRQEPVPSEC
jgi:hypothetical protein